jgi:hypothetical protein
MKSLQKQGFSTGYSSSPLTRIPALSRRVCQKFARNHDFVPSTLSGVIGPSANPRGYDPWGNPASFRGAATRHGARRISTVTNDPRGTEFEK